MAKRKASPKRAKKAPAKKAAPKKKVATKKATAKGKLVHNARQAGLRATQDNMPLKDAMSEHKKLKANQNRASAAKTERARAARNKKRGKK